MGKLDVDFSHGLTDEQMARLGAVDVPHGADLSQGVTDDQLERMTEKPQALPPTEDEKLGIDSGLAKPKGVVWDSKSREFRKASEIGKEQAMPPGAPVEQGLIHEDPAMTLATTTAGMGAGKAAGFAVRKLSPMLARIAEPAVAGATSSYLQHRGWAPTMGDVKAGGIGALFGIPGAAMEYVRGAPAAVSDRLPTAVTAGARTKAAKKVIASDVTNDVLDAHPDLKKVMATSTDPEQRLGAAASALNKLESEQAPVYEAIQKHHGGVPVADIESKLDKAAADAEAHSDVDTMDAIEGVKKNLARLAKNGNVTAQQLRSMRNTLAARVQTAPPGSPAFGSQAATASKLKGALNDAIDDIAGRTPGVDVAALKERNRQIVAIENMQKTLSEQKLNAAAAPIKNTVAKVIDKAGHPAHAIAGLTDAADAKLTYKLATSPGLQRFANGARLPLPEHAGTHLMGGAAASLARGKRRQNDLEYSARVSQLMNDGMSLHEAVEKANEE